MYMALMALIVIVAFVLWCLVAAIKEKNDDEQEKFMSERLEAEEGEV